MERLTHVSLFSGIGGAIFPLVFTQLFQVISWQGVYYVNAVLVLLILVFSLTVFSTDPAKSGLEVYGPMAEQSQAAAGSKPGVPLKYALGSHASAAPSQAVSILTSRRTAWRFWAPMPPRSPRR